ncbi:MAG: hypothetical protein ABIZ34_01840 [Candidatus Limnocylindrales bacterium]
MLADVMKWRGRQGVLAGALAVLSTLVLAVQPAMAYDVITATGVTGDYSVIDAVEDPVGRCAFGPPDSGGEAKFVWMRVEPPSAYARDISPGRDHQQVSWRLRLQIGTSSSGPWSTVGSSAWAQARAYEDAPAPLPAAKVFDSSGGTKYYRGVMQIRWHRYGMVEGSTSLWLTFFSAKWTVGSPDSVFEYVCPNRAD